MWRLRILIISTVIGLLLTLAAAASLPVHFGQASQSAHQNCSTACLAHAQLATMTTQRNNQTEDDKEPTPPPSRWLPSPFNLALLSSTPVVVITWLYVVDRKLLLSRQLRF
mgnify:CR=1 FL=1